METLNYPWASDDHYSRHVCKGNEKIGIVYRNKNVRTCQPGSYTLTMKTGETHDFPRWQEVKDMAETLAQK